jgi:hypothetical protein
VHWMQRLISSAATRGPNSFLRTTLFCSM